MITPGADGMRRGRPAADGAGRARDADGEVRRRCRQRRDVAGEVHRRCRQRRDVADAANWRRDEGPRAEMGPGTRDEVSGRRVARTADPRGWRSSRGGRSFRRSLFSDAGETNGQPAAAGAGCSFRRFFLEKPAFCTRRRKGTGEMNGWTPPGGPYRSNRRILFVAPRRHRRNERLEGLGGTRAFISPVPVCRNRRFARRDDTQRQARAAGNPIRDRDLHVQVEHRRQGERRSRG